MTLADYIVNDISIQPLTTGVGDIKKMFNELTYSHIPVEHNGKYLGCISENDIRCFESSRTLADYQYSLLNFFKRQDDNWLNILESFAQNDTNLLPVLEEQTDSYLGYIELSDMVNYFQAMPFFKEAGSVIIVEHNTEDFSFGEISQIVESSHGKLFGVLLSRINKDRAQITLKVSPANINEILQGFRRFGYRIIGDHREDNYLQNLKERSEYLNKYLNI